MRTKTAFAIFALSALGATAVYADKGMKDADASGDGFVSLDEFKAAHSARIEEHFVRMDTNADGLLSADEMQAAKKARRGDRDKKRDGKHHGKKNPEEMVKRLDADGSGSVSQAELDGKRFSPDAATFQAADADGSGELDATELQAMMKARWAERRAERQSKDD
ncbi:MAG: hypothetical protein KJO01_09785 [Gammaproteobacteria bacterium]|nr:hypothetical protein [Gammaproteobacteria bacterium]MBT8110504.1 hypothetical protein [Gammaproteobacteria bacterium]NND46400.1 hypothetical protein [Woeseiaceae bacterium]NNL45204.1 hypothetical protein [Woeseiaceae bacterium]